MPTAEERIEAYDLIRCFAIVVVFLGHSIIGQTTVRYVSAAFATLSPGLTMSLLGFLSAILLAGRQEDTGVFLARRLTRIYIPLFLCLGAALLLQSLIGTARVNQDTIVHFLGMSWAFSLVSAQNDASIGAGLWFVTVILLMYLLLPLLRRLFTHTRGTLHILIIVVLGVVADHWLNAAGAWNVVMAFCVGTYLVVSDRLDAARDIPLRWSALGACALLTLCALATTRVIPFWVRGLLLPFYPLAFLPLFVWTARRLPRLVNRATAFFALVGLEFYILHFYFINAHFAEFFGPMRLALRIPVSFVVTLALATILSFAGRLLRRRVEGYLLHMT